MAAQLRAVNLKANIKFTQQQEKLVRSHLEYLAP